MEKSKLEEFNHWWAREKIDPELALPFKRESYTEIEGALSNKFIIALTGLRRIGKTTTLYQLIQKLIERKIESTNILFFSFDDSSAKLTDVIESYRDFHNKDFRDEKIYVFLDEIQKCDNWENELKRFYDLYPKLKFIISGSESLFIKKKTKETLAGRIFEFILAPFNFKEYLKFQGIKEEDFKYETKIKPFFIKFAEKGGFPETFSFNDKEFKEYVRALVTDKIIYRDIPKTFKIADPEFLGVLLQIISANPGMYLDYQSLSKQFNKDRRVIKDYITYLKETFLIRLLENYRKNNAASLRKRKRAYPADNALIYLYSSGIDDSLFGKMAETLAVNNLQAQYFWRNGNEVDIIQNGSPIEIKYQNSIDSGDLTSLRAFMKKFRKKQGFLITKKDEREMNFEEGTIKLIPLWKWLLL